MSEETITADYYRVLGVPRSATAAEIREAYIELVKKFHPDRLGAYPEPAAWQTANTRLAEFNEAFNVLGDPARRKEYDAGRPPESDAPPRDHQAPSDRVYMVVLGSALVALYYRNADEAVREVYLGPEVPELLPDREAAPAP